MQKYAKRSWTDMNSEADALVDRKTHRFTVASPAQGSQSSQSPDSIIIDASFTAKNRNQDRRPAVPPKKRQKLGDFMSEKAYADLGLAFDSGDAGEVCGRDSAIGGDISCDASAAEHPLGEPLLRDSTARGDNSESTNSLVVPSNALLTAVESPESSMCNLRNTLDAPRCRIHLDSSRPVDSFGVDAVKVIKLAAEFLLSSRIYDESFDLFVLLVKCLRASPSFPDWMTTSAILGCARTCTKSSQVEIARNLLEQKTC